MEVTEALKHLDRHRLFSSQLETCAFVDAFNSKLRVWEHRVQEIRAHSFQLSYTQRQGIDLFKHLSQAFGTVTLAAEGAEREGEEERNRKISSMSQQDKKTDSKRSTPDTHSSASSHRPVSALQAPKNTLNNAKSGTFFNPDADKKKKFSQGRKISGTFENKAESGHTQGKEVDDIFSKADMFQVRIFCSKVFFNFFNIRNSMT